MPWHMRPVRSAAMSVGPQPQEAINHVVTMFGAVEDSLRDHFSSFGRGVELEHVTFPFAPARGRVRIVPDV
jgi:hypothetical protein